MYRVIMAPTEGSDAERGAISVAAKLAQRFDADLHLVRVLVPPIITEAVPQIPPLKITRQALAYDRLRRPHKLEALATEVRAGGRIRVTTALQEGNLTQTLRDYAAEINADLIVMSSHSRGGLKRIDLGSVTDFLIRNTHIPVLVVKPDVSFIDEASDNTARRIVVPLDGSPLAEEVLPEVAVLAKQLNASVSLLRVLTADTYSQKQVMQRGLPWWDIAVAAANAYLTRTANYLAHLGVASTLDVVLSDDVARAILDYGKRTGANLIAIATSGAGGMSRFVFGTVADEVARRSETSVLVFHPKRGKISYITEADADARAMAGA